MKLESILIENEEGTNEVPLKDYMKAIVKEMELPPFKRGDQEIEPLKIVNQVVKSVSSGKEVADQITEYDDFDYSPMVERVTADVEGTIKALKEKADNAAAEKERKKKEKEEEKKRKEKEAAELKVRQEAFVKEVASGADSAADEFLKELDGIKENLPDGVAIAQNGSGFGIVIDDKASDASIGQAIGYFYQADQNNQFLSNQIQFFIGDLAAAAVQKGLFNTALEAGKNISAYLESQGKRLGVQAIESYRRMAQRTPVELRNAKADPTAYLELTKIKRPKKGEDESKEDFAARVKSFEGEIESVMKKISEGEILSRKDVMEPALEVQYNCGLKERPDPDAKPELSVTDMLRIFFMAGVALDQMTSVDAEGEEVEDKFGFTDKEANEVVWVSREELETMQEEVKSSLMNKFLAGKKHSVKDALRGYTTEMKPTIIGEDADGKPMKEDREHKTPLYLPVFFPVDRDENAEGSGSDESSEEKPAAKKVAKKKAAAK